VFRIIQPTKDTTGIPDIDAAYERAKLDLGGWA
jgi:hypothetical protein